MAALAHIPGDFGTRGRRAQIVVNSVATGECQAEVRRKLEQWLVNHHIEQNVVADIVLGTAEALSNVVRHAYRALPRPGSMTLIARLSEHGVVVTVRDEGSWQDRQARPPDDHATGGWGLPLMRSLSQSLTIDSPTAGLRSGTTVTAQYDLG